MAKGVYKQLMKIIKDEGGFLVRQGKGSHEVWQGPNGQPGSISRSCKSRHTANVMLKKLGIDKKL